MSLDRVVVVLVEPQHPGNVGAAARAMKNMGMSHLVVVAPPAFDPERARWMAPGCDDLLASASLVPALDDALAGVHRVVASTARHRRSSQPVLSPAEVATQVLDAPDDHVTALLFGREDFGLSREHTQRADSILRIPTPEHASLNLAQAVLLVCHALFEEARGRGGSATGRTVGGRARRTTRALDRKNASPRADLPTMEPVVGELVALLERVGYTRGASPDKVALTARELLQGASPSVRQVRALRGMLARLQWTLDHPEVDWRATRRGRED